MKTWLAPTSLMVLLVLGCGGEGGIGEITAAIGSDQQVLKEVQAAANSFAGNAGDCQAVSANYGDMKRKLDEAAGRIQTSSGRTTLQSLRRQAKTIADACGVQ